MTGKSTSETYRPLVVGATCRDDECDWGPLGADDPARSWDIIERLRIDHEDETGHQTRVECVREERILPEWSDRDRVGEHLLELADAEVEHVCPECDRVASESDPAKRCPECDEPWRQVVPDGGRRNACSRETDTDQSETEGESDT